MGENNTFFNNQYNRRWEELQEKIVRIQYELESKVFLSKT